MLTVKVSAENGVCTAVVGGRIDSSNAAEFEQRVTEADTCPTLILDLEPLEYISSAGLRVLLSAQKKMNKQGEMKLVHVSRTIMEIFEVTGFSDILTIE